MIHIIRTRATQQQMSEMLQILGTYVKLAIDVQQRILAGGGAMYADCEAALLEDGSQQLDVWGADWNPTTGGRMKDWTAIRERYLRDSLPVRLGGLAANLSHIKSFSAQEASRDAVESMLDESKYFIEWTAAEAEVQTASQLVELQVQLAHWQLTWPKTWNDPLLRTQLAEQSATWSRRVLEMSGLLNG